MGGVGSTVGRIWDQVGFESGVKKQWDCNSGDDGKEELTWVGREQ